MVQNVVIVGAGPAGLNIAIQLAPKLDATKYQLVLVSERDASAHLIAGLRANVTDDQKLEENAFFPLDKFFRPGRPGKVVVGRVVSIDEEQVHLENGETVPYAVLVLATGSIWRGMLNFPTKKSDAAKSIAAWREKFKKAKSVLIIGGGAVGVELAGEVRDYYPNTEVTLVHAQKYLLNDAYSESFRKKLGAQFEKAGVKLLLDQTVLDIPSDPTVEITGPVKTAKGETLTADLVILAVGPQPNASVATTLDASVLTPEGRVKVLPTLQVPLASGKRNVFAAGDIIDFPEQHTAYRTSLHAPVVAANVLSVLAGTEPKKLYKATPELIVVTRGRAGGLGSLPFFGGVTMPGFLVKSIKSKDLLVGMTKKNLGY